MDEAERLADDRDHRCDEHDAAGRGDEQAGEVAAGDAHVERDGEDAHDEPASEGQDFDGHAQPQDHERWPHGQREDERIAGGSFAGLFARRMQMHDHPNRRGHHRLGQRHGPREHRRVPHERGNHRQVDREHCATADQHGEHQRERPGDDRVDALHDVAHARDDAQDRHGRRRGERAFAPPHHRVAQLHDRQQWVRVHLAATAERRVHDRLAGRKPGDDPVRPTAAIRVREDVVRFVQVDVDVVDEERQRGAVPDFGVDRAGGLRGERGCVAGSATLG